MKSAPVRYHYGKFPPTELNWAQLIPLIGPANARLARYDGLLLAIPNADILLTQVVLQEAVLSTRIEGTNVTLGEVLEIEASGQTAAFAQAKVDDASEVLNYREAVRACAQELGYRPLSQRMLRQAHEVLMKGVRGRDKSPGRYRVEQNWIGDRGSPIEEAKFIPIDPLQLQSGMDEWLRYLGSTDEPDALVQLAILHVEFEALHPFMDGNGRLGRMLIPLYLHQRGILSTPAFYISGYLEAHRDLYLERLRAVSRDGDWTGWCEFFLRGIREKAEENERKARAILSLYNRLKNQVADLTRSQHAIRAVDFIFQSPIFRGSQFTTSSGIPKASASRILTVLSGDQGPLRLLRAGKGRQPGLYVFSELLNIAEGDDVF